MRASRHIQGLSAAFRALLESKEMSLKYLAQYFLLSALLLGPTLFCRAQESKPQGEQQSPPPPPAIEYNPKNWEELSSTEGGFSIAMPGIPYVTNQETETAAGKIPQRTYQLKTSTASYLATYGIFPVNPEDPADIKKMLDAIRDSILTQRKDNKLLGEYEIALDKETGREWLIEEGDSIIRHRVFFIKGRLYQLFISTTRNVVFKTGRSGSEPKDRTEFYEMISSKFFNSFKLLPRAKGSQAVSVAKTPESEAIDELTEAVRAYKAGKFAEAQQHAERALKLNPPNKIAPLFIARSIHSQYKPGVNTPENILKARAAIIAYERILARDQNNDEAYRAIAFLLGDIKEEEKQRQWILQRATGESVPKDKRAEAYTVLASRDWKCSYDITELPENKTVTNRKGAEIISYRKPQNQADFVAAWKCAVSGLEKIERAISLAPKDDAAWSYKGHLLFEMAKLAEMNGQRKQQAEYRQQADEAWAQSTALQAAKEQRAP